MAFVHGKSTVVYGAEFDLSPYFNSASYSTSIETGETTAFGASAKTYIVGLESGTVSVEGLWDGDTDAIDQILASFVGADDQVLTIGTEGNAIGSKAWIVNAPETSYEISSPLSDVVGISAEFEVDGGIDNGVILHTGAETTTPVNSASVDHGASTTNGAIANLHVVANTRTASSTFKVQHSSDNSTWVDLITFTSVAGTTKGKESTAITTNPVNRYLRAQATLGGTTNSATYTIAIARR